MSKHALYKYPVMWTQFHGKFFVVMEGSGITVAEYFSNIEVLFND